VKVELATSEATVLSDDEGQTIVFGTDEEYLLLSRPDDPRDEWGVYVEYSDQVNSAYDCVATCALRGARLELELSKPLGPRCDASGFLVDLTLSEPELAALVDGLRSVFRGRERALEIDARD
jgi:hypothetical protein